MDERTAGQAEMLSNRIAKNLRRLRKWRTREAITCFRAYDADVPEIPLAIDYYDGRLHIAEYQRRSSPAGAAHGPWLDALGQAAASALEVDPLDVFIKRRQRQRGASQYTAVSKERARFIVTEGGLKFWVNLSDYLDTGLFLDHRQTRAMMAERSRGARVLNLFAYTGSFTVYAIAGGARETVTVDLSPTYLRWARENLAANGMTGKHRFVRSDAMRFLAEAGEYDLIVVDPPTFSNSKKMRGVFDIQRDHEALLEGCFARLAPGGCIMFSTNFRRFKPANIVADRMHEITHKTVPPDFRNQRIHRAFLGER